MRRNIKAGNDLRGTGKQGSRSKRRARQMFFETLESRQLLAVVTNTDVGTFWETYTTNYVPPQEYKAALPDYLSAPSSASPLTIAIDYLKQNAAEFGLESSDLNHYTVTNQYTDAHNGVTHIYLQQKYNGLPVADALASIHVTAAGRVLSAGINFVPDLIEPPPFSTPAPYISAQTALTTLASQSNRSVDAGQLTTHPFGGPEQTVYFSGPGLSGFAASAVGASLHYVPKPDGRLELAWKFVVRYADGSHWFEGSIGAQFGGRVGQLIRLADYRNDASYNVLPFPLRDPLDGNFNVVVDPQDPVASPFGWHDINGFVGPEFFDTRGNNVSAQDDLNGDDQGGLYGLPVAPGVLDFNTLVILPLGAPASYLEAATINAFYWANLAHDISFHYGFTEIAGNFQQENYSNLGMDDDPVRVDVQDSMTQDNANMFTPPDGQPGIMNLGISTAFTPNRDISLDNHIIVHEYTHGISNRLTGGPANASALVQLQSGGMGEGWSDWFALMLTTDFTTDDADTPQLIGDWVFGPPATGIRRQPYSFDMTVNPITLDDYNGVDFVTGLPNSEVHNSGEIWASALWDMSWLLIEKHGFDPDFYNGDGGNNLAIQLVFDGMKLQPANPSFLEARDAILAADLALTGGANYTEIWEAFARRGFGATANDGGSAAASIVTESFVVPPPLTGVSGTVYEDFNNNNQIDPLVDLPLAGWVVYADLNNNSIRDLGEPQSTTATDGTYSLPLTTPGTVTIREVVQTGYQRVLPSSGGFSITVSQGTNFTGRNFLNRQAPGEITGLKFNDFNGNGTRDTGEPGLAGVMIYVDVNKDGRIGVLEPAGVTDANGVYRILNVPVGTGIHVREVVQPGMVQTFPSPTGPSGGGYTNVAVTRGGVTTGINFGNQQRIDFGDAPASYGTTLAANGPRHGIVAGYGLTLETFATNDPNLAVKIARVVDAESNGLVHPTATGDDVTGLDDENGVEIPALSPGSQPTIRVGVRTNGYSAGALQGWIDFNRDGDFLDAGEQVIKDLSLATGIHFVQITVPPNAQLGSTFARFRYGVERGIGPLGAAVAGEVEDYATTVLQDMPIAVDDVFPDLSRVPPDAFIKLNSSNNPLDVLRNDFGTTLDPTPEIISTIFFDANGELETAAGGLVKFQGATLPLLYTPKLGYTGPDSFQYAITAGDGSFISFGNVTINISPSDPIAIDDIVRFNTGAATGVDVFVLANDVAALNQPIKIKAGSVQLVSTSAAGTTLVPSASGDRLIFTAPPTFSGTVRYRYTIEDNDVTTADSSAIVTIQVTPDPSTPAASHAAIFRTQYIAADQFGNPIGGPTSTINLANSEFFFVQLIVNDPAGTPAGLPETTGVESAYVDLLVNEVANNPLLPMVEPVIEPNGTFDILFTSQYTLVRADNPDFSTPGVLNEIGASHDSTPAVQPGLPTGVGNGERLVMSVKFRALQGGTVNIQADHADSPQLPILLFDGTTAFPGPIQISDDQVFIVPSQPLTILGGSGEGEFTNLGNFYDVNADGIVNTLDILMIVNDMTLHGARSLNQFAIALAGVLPEGYLDTNLDSTVNTLDILGIVNYLTSRGAVVSSSGGNGEGEGGEGEAGEGESMAAFLAVAAPAADPADEALNVLATEQNREVAETPAVAAEPQASIVAPSGTSAEESVLTSKDDESALGQKLKRRLGGVDSDAADELFSRLSDLREQLRSRRRGR
jgi:Zn-dependent metalloprotease